MNGEHLKKIRLNQNLTQQKLADILDVSRSIIAKIEGGENKVSEKLVEKLIEKFPQEVINYRIGHYNAWNDIDYHIKENLKELKEYKENNLYVKVFYNQYFEYLKRQGWLINICQLLYYECGRKFSQDEIKDIFTAITGINTEYIDNYSESSIKRFLDERKPLLDDLIDKYLKEYFNHIVTLNKINVNLDFLE